MSAGIVSVLSASLLAGCSSAATSQPSSTSTTSKTVTVASLRGTTGPTASLGVPGNNGLQLAIDSINSHGGLLGKQIKLKLFNDQANPNISDRNARNAILSDQAVALFGPVSSADAAPEEQVATKYKTIMFSYTANDVHLTTTGFSPYFFSVVPNTYMEPRAVAEVFKQHHWTRIYTISPNYSYGHSEVNGFLKNLKSLGVHYTLVGQQWPALGASNFTNYITAILNAHPQAVFGGIYGTDLLTFTKEALPYSFFQKVHFAAQYGAIDLQALGKNAPVGAIGFARGAWWTQPNSPTVQEFVKAYRAKYGSYPSSYSWLGYSAAQTWAYGVKKANSFNSAKIAKVLAGATVPTIRGSIHIRSCDHQAVIPEFVGIVHPSKTLPFDTYNPVYPVSSSQLMDKCTR